jgi:hypothetical protein
MPIFFELHKLKKAIWFGKDVMINEITKTQEMVLKQLNILVPKIEWNLSYNLYYIFIFKIQHRMCLIS